VLHPLRTGRWLWPAIAVIFVLSCGLPADDAHSDDSHRISAGVSWATSLATVRPGDTVRLAEGMHGPQLLQNRDFGGVTVLGTSRSTTVVAGLYLKNVQGLTFRGFSVTSSAAATSAVRVTDNSSNIVFSRLRVAPRNDASGFDIFSNSGSSRPPHNIKVTHSTYSGANAWGRTARGVRLFGGSADPATWPHHIVIRRSDIGYAPADAIQIGGARQVRIVGNRIHDVQENADHNDGIQSYGSDGLFIARNRLWASGADGGPDQAIMLAHSPTDDSYLRVSNTKIVNNIVTGWRGQGISLSGTSETWVMNNTSVSNGGSSFVVGTAFGPNEHLRVFNNIFDNIYRFDRAAIWYENYNLVGRGGEGSQDLSKEPRFSDTSSWALDHNSPAIDRGQENGAPKIDFAGRVRTGRPDLGAQEQAR